MQKTLNQFFLELFDIFKLKINLSQNAQVVKFLSDFVNLYKLSAEDIIVKSKPFSNAQPAWWDYDCQEARTNKILTLIKFRLTHSNYDLVTYKSKRNQFKALCKLKKARMRNKKRNELVNCHNDAKTFWSLLKSSKVTPSNRNSLSNIDFLSHFKTLLDKDIIVELDSSFLNEIKHIADSTQLNAPISIDEIYFKQE